MEHLLNDIVDWLIRSGPWVVFLVAMIETALFIGLLVPAEATVLVAGFLVYRGVFPLDEIFAATFFGGLAGDQIGYGLGRRYGARVIAHGGPLARLWGRNESVAVDLFRRHAMLAVTLARFLSFVRTLMPWSAGMSGVSYPRFLAFDLLGVLGWAAGSVALGYAAGPSWRVVADALGTATGALLGLLAVVGGVLLLRRSRQPGSGAAKGDRPEDP